MSSDLTAPEEQEPNTLLMEDSTLSYGFVLLPKLVLYARNLSRDAKLLYAVLLGYAWQEQRCWPGYTRLCADLDASENAVRKYMRELEMVHLLSQRRRGLGLSNLYTLHDPRTAKIEVQEPHKTKVQEPHKTKVQEPQKSEDNKETREIETKEEIDRSIGERPLKKSPENAEIGEKTQVGGEPAGCATDESVRYQAVTTGTRRAPARGKHVYEQDGSPRERALAHARAVAGATIEERLRGLGAAHPEGGAQTILEALVDVQTPDEAMGTLLGIGERRLEQQQEREHIPNPTGYLITVMRNLAVEAWLKGWNLPQIQAEDEEKHAEALRAAQREGACVLIGESEVCPAAEKTDSSAGEATGGETPAVCESRPHLPDGVEVADVATVATWRDKLPDPRGGQERAASMLWGFVREEIRGQLNVARRSQLEGLIPKWDATRPRTLLLISDTTWSAQAAHLNLRREIEAQIGTLLSDFFDEMQVVYAPGLEEPV